MEKKNNSKKSLHSNDNKKIKKEKRERKLDRTLEDTFPASDPITKY
jgi:hypothetical protein